MLANKGALALFCLVFAAVVAWRGSGPCLAQPAGQGDSGLASRLLGQQKPEPGRAARLREVLAKEPPAGAGPEELGRFHYERSHAAAALGNVAQQMADLSKAVELGQGPLVMHALIELGGAQSDAGNVRQALDNLERAKALAREANSGALIKIARMLSAARVRLGDLAAAGAELDDAEAMFRAKQSRRGRASSNFDLFEAGWQAQLQRSRAGIAMARGRWAEAESLLRQALVNQEKSFDTVEQRAARTGRAISEDMTLDGRDSLLARIADVQRAQGRAAEAELTLREALAASLARVGRDSIVTARQCLVYAQLLSDTGRAEAGEAFAREALASLERIGVAPHALQAAQARLALAESLGARGRWKEALAVYAELMARLAPAPGLAKRLGQGNITWAQALVETGQADKAADMLRLLAAEAEERQGKDGYAPQELRGMLGVALSRAGRKAEALAELRLAIPALLSAAPEEQLPVKRERRRLILSEAIALLAAREAGAGAAAEAFLLADALHGSGTQGAVSAAAARGAAGSPELAALVRQEQDKRMEEEGLRRTLAEVLSLPQEQQSAPVIRGLKEQLASLDAERKRLREALSRRFPAYADLLRPRPASLAQARAALRGGERLLSILSTDRGSYLWAAGREGQPLFAASPMTSARVAELVKGLRASLDPKDGDLDRAPAFDLAAAHALYAGLVAPVEAGLAGAENVLAVTGGALSQLPLALLVTGPAKAAPVPGLPYAEYRDVPWLIRRAAMTQLPSASALITLRQARPGAAGRAAFLGLGDPEFSAQQSLAQAAAPGASRGIRLRSLPRQARGADSRALREAAVGAAGVVGFADYAALPPLPDTREEILAIAAALGADPKTDVLLGRAASVAALKAQDLTRRRILAFATHGLVPGDLPGLDQPALALSSPGPGQTGLLTLEDILGLKLDADWVVLSACNTAAGEGAGADAVSGLGRAFFYAGGRSLLVTHWPVETVSARQLVSGVFSSLGGGGISRAEALRRSILQLMEAPGPKDSSGRELYSYAHPIFWAPYALVGEDGVR